MHVVHVARRSATVEPHDTVIWGADPLYKLRPPADSKFGEPSSGLLGDQMLPPQSGPLKGLHLALKHKPPAQLHAKKPDGQG